MRPTKQCYWTRKLELDLINFMRHREYMWKPTGNTNHQIQQKYKTYAEFASAVGRSFTARSVRDRWVNIRSTFNHNMHRVLRSKLKANSPSDIYVPCWPLWKPLQFLRSAMRKEYDTFETIAKISEDCKQFGDIKQEIDIDIGNTEELSNIKQQDQRTNRPRHKASIKFTPIDRKKNIICGKLLDDLLMAMKPFESHDGSSEQSYWFFGKHVTERLNCMRQDDADCAARDIIHLLNKWPE